jgi:homoserine dehydrogenase
LNGTKVAIIGLGTVGSGVAEILCQHNERVARHAGQNVELARVVVRDLGKRRDYQLPKGLITNDVDEVIKDPSIKIVAQLVGGLEPARTIMLRLLESGKDVVTANKALLAEHGTELFGRARELGRAIAFEASVAGGVPIITNISQCLSANQISSLRGILNGTSNFIVTQMEESGRDYAEALQEAQARGYAEADPAMDVDGSDAAQKLAILAHLAFGAEVNWSNIPREGIESLMTADMQCAADLGYRIKLLAVAQLHEDELELHVSPTLVRQGTPLAEVRGAYNAVSVVGDTVGKVFYHGLGAGRMPTASAVVADLIDMVVGRAGITFQTLELWSGKKPRVALTAGRSATSRYYLRIIVRDCPGVLADIASVLGRHGISVASMIQHEAESDSPADGSTLFVPIVIMTHSATAGAMSKAFEGIDQLATVKGPSIHMRVLD